MAQLPTWDELYTWASTKPGEAVLGFSRNSLMGPVNLFFTERGKDALPNCWMIGFAKCGVLDWKTLAYGKFLACPQWLRSLNMRCDQLADTGFEFLGFNRPITAKQFKEALEHVRPKTRVGGVL